MNRNKGIKDVKTCLLKGRLQGNKRRTGKEEESKM